MTKINKGFTLIELVVTIGVIAIFGALAYPSYRDYSLTSQLTEGMSRLQNEWVNSAQYYQDNRTYETMCSEDRLKAMNKGLDYFTISCPTVEENEITLQAADKNGFIFTINELGEKSTLGVDPKWTLPEGNACWVSKKNGECRK
jgi:type IV pilus assembly protein PilE